MRLSYDDICRITLGAVRIEQYQDSIRFFRFTQAQQEMYLRTSPDGFYKKTFATSGIRLCFTTDSAFMRLHYRMTYANGRTFGGFDVYENGVLIAHFGGETTQALEGDADISFGAGEKLVQIYFPWSLAGEILSMELEDGAFFRPVKKDMTILAFGDSITQGYDARYPSLSYISRISDKLNAVCINKGIGGERFCPELLDSKDDLCPDLITVAYGTNDWSNLDRESFADRCDRFFRKLTACYPDVKIVAVTPVWRKDHTRETAFGAPLDTAVQLMEEICREFPGVTVIRGEDLTPHLGEFYSDGYLHPNDLGFVFYAERLYPEILKVLKERK